MSTSHPPSPPSHPSSSPPSHPSSSSPPSHPPPSPPSLSPPPFYPPSPSQPPNNKTPTTTPTTKTGLPNPPSSSPPNRSPSSSSSSSNPSSTKWDARLSSPGSRHPHPLPHDASYYLKCMLGGIISCGGTHTAVCPLDVVKCKMQVFPQKYTGLGQGIKTVLAEEGWAGLRLGWAPTAIGYSMQGLFKFGLYEFFKDFYMNLAGEEKASKHKGLIWLAGSASAEFFADIALCPMEMVKVKVQTAKPGTWPTSLVPATSEMWTKRADTYWPLGSVVPLWGRQIPYTMAKFFFFEKVVQLFYTHLFTAPKETYNKATQLSVTFASGYIAGVICAIVSQAPDNLVSQMGKPDNKGKSFAQIASEIGTVNLFTKGLSIRILMIGTLTGLQWWIYDSFKSAMGMGTTGGK